MVSPELGGRILYEFEIAPPNVESLGVVFDITRQIQNRIHEIAYGSGTPTPIPGFQKNFPWLQNPPKDNERVNDDNLAFDEDNTPSNRLIYSFDSPQASLTGTAAFIIVRHTFKEWVRIKLDNSAFVHQQDTEEGSRASNKYDWHCVFYLKRTATGEVAEDNTSPSACAPKLTTGTPSDKGTLAVAVNAANAVTEGWSVKYDAADDEWDVTGDDGSSGTLTKQGDVWQGEGKKAANTRVTLTVTHTAGKPAFANDDEFEFSTFKSTAAGGKKNETSTGELTVTGGP